VDVDATGRTLDICGRLVDDRVDTVVKALSWAVRALAPWDPVAVGDFLEANDTRLAARVRREVRTKLATGRKHPPSGSDVARRRPRGPGAG
jgi:3-methyladenine DNA glycosylase AlkD